MANYYFLINRFPELELGHPPMEDYNSLIPTIRGQLSSYDSLLLKEMGLYYDILNCKALLRGEALSPYGNYNTQQLQECLELKQGLPDFILDYFNYHEDTKSQLKHFAALLKGFFVYSQEKHQAFMKDYFSFERDCRIILTAFRAKHMEMDVGRELQFEDPYDSLVALVLAQKDAKHFDPPEAFAPLKEAVERYKQSPMGLQKAYEEFRLAYLQERSRDFSPFSFDRVVAYLIQLIAVEQWHQLELQEKQGKKNITTILEAVP